VKSTPYQYLLDTNVVSDLIRNPQGNVTKRISQFGEARVCTSIVVACELRYGAAKRASKKLTEQVEQVLSVLPVLPLVTGIEEVYADIRIALESKETPIGANDLLIAAHARVLGMTLVTANEREFRRVTKLKVVNWLSSSR
jgi:tRNA(fMet)-specific endonuclease VapC